MKRWPVIRHVRYWWLCYRVERWAWTWYQAGVGIGVPHPSDVEWLNRIWRGDA